MLKRDFLHFANSATESSKEPVINPEFAFCGITSEIMFAPVILSTCGHSFEEEAIKEHFRTIENLRSNVNVTRCPICNTPADSGHLVTNWNLKDAIVALLAADESLEKNFINQKKNTNEQYWVFISKKKIQM